MRKKNQTYYVSRQIAWPDGARRVEIVAGGREHASPGELSPAYRSAGEGQEFTCPVEAAEAAIVIARLWRGDDRRKVAITMGASLGGMFAVDEVYSVPELRKHAADLASRLVRCDQCGEPVKGEGESWFSDDAPEIEDMTFCSARCARKAIDFYVRDRAESEEV